MVWCRYDLEVVLVSFWCGMVSVWLLHGTGVDWVCGFGMAAVWCWTGFGMVSVWLWYGTR